MEVGVKGEGYCSLRRYCIVTSLEGFRWPFDAAKVFFSFLVASEKRGGWR